MELNILQKGFNFSQDGPGNRLVYHLQGCNFRCPWCSNPESIAVGGSMMIPSGVPKESDCIYGAVQNGVLDREKCAGCKDKPCQNIPGCVIRHTGQKTDVQAVFEEILSAQMMFFDGGGVTLTGGEAGIQFQAVCALLKLCRENHIHTAVESNASHPDFCRLAEDVDYLIVDLKQYDDVKHRAVIGASNRNTLANIKKLASSREQLLIRIPLIQGFNASEADAAGFSAFLKGLDRQNTDVEILRYHEYGKDKWAQCGMTYSMQDGFVPDDAYKAFVSVLENSGISIVKT